MTLPPRWVLDDIMETPKLGRPWCPGCSPECDPTREILDVSWCAAHKPPEAGTDDAIEERVQRARGGSERDRVLV